MSFKYKDLKLTSTKQFNNKNDLEIVFNLAQKIENTKDVLGLKNVLSDKVVATLFYEPSTRTKLSFNSATVRLGAGLITETSPQFSSMYKGETLEDSLKTIEQYCEMVIMRHPQAGSAKIASEILNIPFINAGDGAEEHPTQALLDIYTIFKEKKSLNGLHIALIGDLRYGRTVHSLIELLKFYEIKLSLISPEQLKLPEKSYQTLNKNNMDFSEYEEFENNIENIDVLYVTRIQKERFVDNNEYEKLKNNYVINKKSTKNKKKDLIIMHPLPRLEEIDKEMDLYPGAAYFRQIKNGLYIRMALMALMFGRESEINKL